MRSEPNNPLSQNKTCVNGCDAPVHPPSCVLCKACFLELDRKIEAIGKSFGISPKGSIR